MPHEEMLPGGLLSFRGLAFVFFWSSAKENTPHTARMAHDQALAKVMQHLLKDDTQVCRQFIENGSFKRFVGDMLFAIPSQ